LWPARCGDRRRRKRVGFQALQIHLVGVHRRIQIPLELVLDGPGQRCHVVAQEEYFFQRVRIIHHA
jgi:hypothetical protein